MSRNDTLTDFNKLCGY